MRQVQRKEGGKRNWRLHQDHWKDARRWNCRSPYDYVFYLRSCAYWFKEHHFFGRGEEI
jgi:hypothetical protein